MSAPAEFLRALARALSARRLYGVEHAAYRRAAGRLGELLPGLLRGRSRVSFSFLDGDVAFGDERVPELRGWRWSEELARTGVERIEIEDGASSREMGRLVERLHRRMHEEGGAEPPPLTHVRVGRVGTRDGPDPDAPPSGGSAPGEAAGAEAPGGTPSPGERRAPEAGVDLDEEAATVGWLLGKSRRGGRVPDLVAGAVVRSLSVALHDVGDVLELLAGVREHNEYTALHSMNVSILTMAAAESMGLPAATVKAFGEAALLHDVGMTRISREILQKPGPLTEEEWEEVKRHPAEGARILLESGGSRTLAATVAYEHHLTWRGGGYPSLHYTRRPHLSTRLVQVCDIFDALRTRRPYREPWPVDRIRRHLRGLAGQTVDPESLRVVLRVLERSEGGTPAGAAGAEGRPRVR